MTFTLSRVRLLACLALSALPLWSGCGNAPPNRQPAPGGTPATPTAAEVTSAVSINAVMVRVVDHAAHQLWNLEK